MYVFVRKNKVEKKTKYSPNLQAPIFFHFSAIVDDLSINNFSWFRIVLGYMCVVFYPITLVKILIDVSVEYIK